MAILVLCAACTYGPAQRRVRIDGGRAKISDQSVTIFVADADAQTVRRLARLAAPIEVRTSFGSTMLGWKGTTLYLVLTGCPGSECYGSLTRRLIYRVDDDGTTERVDDVPSDLEQPPGSIARAPGERVYMRVSKTTDSVLVRTDDGGPWPARFVLDRDGQLVPVRRAAP